MIFAGVLPALAPFGLYRIWLATVQLLPLCFYARLNTDVPLPFQPRPRQVDGSCIIIEPTLQTLDFPEPHREGAIWNLFFGLIYVSLSTFALLGSH